MHITANTITTTSRQRRVAGPSTDQSNEYGSGSLLVAVSSVRSPGTPAVELQALLGKEATRPQRLALQRAARVLADKGCIRIFVFWDVATQKHVYVLHRIDYDFERHARAYGLTPYANNCDWIRAATASRGGAGIRLHLCHLDELERQMKVAMIAPDKNPN